MDDRPSVTPHVDSTPNETHGSRIIGGSQSSPFTMGTSHGAAKETPSKPMTEYNYLFYNTWLFDGVTVPVVPPFWYETVADKPERAERAVEIGERIVDDDYWDVIAMSEVFDSDDVDRMLAQTDKAVERVRGPKPDWRKNSGLLHLSTKGMLGESNSHAFDERGCAHRDADVAANKGVLHTLTGEAADSRINLVSTHLLAGGDFLGGDRCDGTREENRRTQVQELTEFVRQLWNDEDLARYPTVIVGDFNVEAWTPEYWETIQPLLDELEMYDAWRSTYGRKPGPTSIDEDDPMNTCEPWDRFDETRPTTCHRGVSYNGRRIDYAFVELPKPRHRCKITDVSISRLPFWRKRTRPDEFYYDRSRGPNYLSDHLGLELNVTLKTEFDDSGTSTEYDPSDNDGASDWIFDIIDPRDYFEADE